MNANSPQSIKLLAERAAQKGKSLAEAHLAWANLEWANLEGAHLEGAHLEWANLEGAHLEGAHLEEAHLEGAHLERANLAGANLAGAHLEGAHLERANLAGANLAGAHLERANLERANLAGANLAGAHLERAHLEGACLPSPAIVISASWGNLSDNVTIALMRLDASGHPDPTAFDRWAQGGNCPYKKALVQRVAHFTERRDLWSPGPPPTLWEAMCMVLDEKCPGWRRKENGNEQS